VGLHHFAARYSDAEPAGPRVVVGPKAGKTVSGRVAAGNGKTPGPKPAKQTGTKKTVTIRLKGKESSTRH
jgi:hypothetical protein